MTKNLSNSLKLMAIHNDQRQSGRLNVNRVNSESQGKPLGEVLNLSATGILIMRRKKMRYEDNERFFVRISCDELEIEVYVKVIWTKRIGFRKHLYGLSFNEQTERNLMIIKRMVMQAGGKPAAYSDALKAAG